MGILVRTIARMRYLSDKWFAAADTAVREADPSAPKGRVVIEQIIEGVVKYQVVIGRGESGVFRSTGDDSSGRDVDAIFTQSESTAQSIASGGTDAHQAFLLGRIHFDGDIEVLIQRRDAFNWLDKVLAPVMAATTFD